MSPSVAQVQRNRNPAGPHRQIERRIKSANDYFLHFKQTTNVSYINVKHKIIVRTDIQQKYKNGCNV